MLKIKLSRTGRRNQPYYRIVVTEKRSKLTGKFIALLGHYNPSHPDNQLTIDQTSYADWIAKGAKPTDTIRKLINKKNETTA